MKNFRNSVLVFRFPAIILLIKKEKKIKVAIELNYIIANNSK